MEILTNKTLRDRARSEDIRSKRKKKEWNNHTQRDQE
jgi:hypothetical protein